MHVPIHTHANPLDCESHPPHHHHPPLLHPIHTQQLHIDSAIDQAMNTLTSSYQSTSVHTNTTPCDLSVSLHPTTASLHPQQSHQQTHQQPFPSLPSLQQQQPPSLSHARSSQHAPFNLWISRLCTMPSIDWLSLPTIVHGLCSCFSAVVNIRQPQAEQRHQQELRPTAVEITIVPSQRHGNNLASVETETTLK
eukprot:TRINITY_DN1576_c0_g1_i2.p1 TRINITY_DN1576_c0_g1~~TRINITY_DN1576_c0_g1_i2.p1  ORF type:complete len:194 (+),score=45.32 TRINITY_DN1576_c0_g1_i2:484-1065(+)